MNKIILLLTIILFSTNLYADCPEFESKGFKIDSIGTLPNNQPIYQVYGSSYMGYSHTEDLIILTINVKSLPKIIRACHNSSKKSFYFDNSPEPATLDEIKHLGIIDIYMTNDVSIQSKTALHGQFLITHLTYSN